VVFPAPPLYLKEGTFTGSDGRRKQNLAASGAAGNIWPEWRVIAALAEVMGGAAAYSSLKGVQEEIDRLEERR
jgi:predicted molibdopterin-dependent oxidoreductase YjgC